MDIALYLFKLSLLGLFLLSTSTLLSAGMTGLFKEMAKDDPKWKVGVLASTILTVILALAVIASIFVFVVPLAIQINQLR